jgi:hypothetical protein
MANKTFGQVWNEVLIHAPNLPPSLAREFVRVAYQEALDIHYWSELRTDAEVWIPDTYTTGTLTMTNVSTTVTGSGTTFTSAMVGRQLAVESIAPWYTITTFNSATEVIIDRAFQGETEAALEYTIGQFYVEFPTNLKVLERIRDQNNGWYLATQWYSQEYLDRVDPKRNSSGTPTMAVYAPTRTDSSGNVIPRYEFWPRADEGRLYHYRYTKDVSLTTNDTRLIDGLTPSTIVYGALAHAAMWPGTPDSPNMLFGVDKQESYMKTFDQKLNDDVLRDIDRNQTMIQEADGLVRRFPIDAAYLQEHYW